MRPDAGNPASAPVLQALGVVVGEWLPASAIARFEAIVKFPDQNPNPVMRIRWDGTLVYANPASAGLKPGWVSPSAGHCLPT